jgi:hypothetical protein
MKLLAILLLSIASIAVLAGLVLLAATLILGLASMFPMVGPGAASSVFSCIRGSRSPPAYYCWLFLAGEYGGLPTEFHFSGYRVYQAACAVIRVPHDTV